MDAFNYRGYVIDFINLDLNYTITKNGILVYRCDKTFQLVADAQVDAKLIINRLEPAGGGWMVS